MLSSQFNQNLIAEQAGQAVWLESQEDLAGLPEPLRLDAAAAARRLLGHASHAHWALALRVTTSVHSFAGGYDAGLYAHLWSDLMDADAAEAFLQSPGGLYDAGVARSWRDAILSAGHTVQAADAFRRFRGRDPDPTALMRRFGLVTA